MAVYLGDEGRILLRRSASKFPAELDLQNSDINPEKRRFSIGDAYRQFITGDRIEISTTPQQDEIPLLLVPGNVNPDGVPMPSAAGYVHVDPMGGLRLYKDLGDALIGQLDDAIVLGELATTSQSVEVKVISRDDENCLGHVSSFSITTSRENIDLTCLSQNYRQSYENGLIEGQGKISCFWDYANFCEEFDSGEMEFAEYLAQLCLRVVQGSDFHGFFFLHYGGSSTNFTRSVWYECADCVITNVAVTVEPTQVVTAEIDFVTSGQIELRQGFIPRFLLKEDEDYLLNENGNKIQLENSAD